MHWSPQTGLLPGIPCSREGLWSNSQAFQLEVNGCALEPAHGVQASIGPVQAVTIKKYSKTMLADLPLVASAVGQAVDLYAAYRFASVPE